MDSKLVKVLFISSLLIILTLTLISYLRFSSFNDFNDTIRKKTEFSVQLKKIEREFMAVVAFQRSYLVGGQDYHETAFERAKELQQKELSKLIDLSQTFNQELRQQCLELGEMLGNKMELLDKEVALSESNKVYDSQKLVDLISDHAGFTRSVIDLIDALESTATRDLDSELDLQQVKGGYTPWSFLLLVILTLVMLGLTYHMLTKEINKRKAISEKQSLLVQKLKISNADLERYAYVASHDLQEPLRKIQLFVDKAISEMPENVDNKQKNYMARIQSSAKRMTLLINDLLAYGRIGGEKEKPKLINVSEAYEKRIEDLLEGEDIKYEVDVEKGIEVKGVESQLNQLLDNLLSNSIKFRDKSKATLRLALESEIHEDEKSDEKYLKVSFSDNGMGFENKYSDQIFTVFNRLVGKNEIEGTGIGLSICKRVMTVHGGFIKAHSKNDKTVFSCFFPLSLANNESVTN